MHLLHSLLKQCVPRVALILKVCASVHACVWNTRDFYSEFVLCCLVTLLCPSPDSIPGEMRVQLFNQSLLDLGLYDDGPYEVADQKQLNAQLIPVPYHSYLGRICPPLRARARTT